MIKIDAQGWTLRSNTVHVPVWFRESQWAHHVQAAVDPLGAVGIVCGGGDAVLGDVDGEPQGAGV